MALEIQEHEREGIAILDMKGRIVVGPEASALREKVAALNAAGKRNVVLNMTDVDFIDSTGPWARWWSASLGLRKNQTATLNW